nr:MAG TPA: hypothetical protein [Caudoviricetes sp.]
MVYNIHRDILSVSYFPFRNCLRGFRLGGFFVIQYITLVYGATPDVCVTINT